jgi:2-succinyl-5-enolpyruvyl-6-hydroxy-3-cyclohexene-1-carboxylate synthase
MSRDANSSSARAMVDEWARAGVSEAAVAPGSRSTPLALALAADPRIRVHVHLDERSAGFFALGTAKISGRPAVALCTSGTAAAGFHPAVLEAHHGRVPLLVCTADRPPELRDTGAGQTIDQARLYGGAVRWTCEVGPPEDVVDAGVMWRSVASRAVAETLGPPAGPVHLNLAYREPLVPTGAPLVDAPGRADGRPWTTSTRARRRPDDDTISQVVAAVRVAPRGVLVAGWGAGVDAATVERFAAVSGWPVLADPLSQLRSFDGVISTYDPLLRVGGFGTAHRPDLVLRLGAPLTSKAAGGWLGSDVAQWLIDPDHAWLDPRRGVVERLEVDAGELLARVADALGDEEHRAWREQWADADRRARRAIDELVGGWEEPFEGRIARDVVAAVPDGTTIAVASSMPVRDVEGFAAPRSGVQYIANRGVNGIDGFVSTVLGGAAVDSSPMVALVGDLCFLHDANGLLGAVDRELDATFVVVDNDGGGIFSFLPQAAAVPDEFEHLFGTPHGIDIAALAAVHRLPVTEVEKSSALAPAVQDAVARGGARVVIVRTDRAENVARHREVWDAVERAL